MEDVFSMMAEGLDGPFGITWDPEKQEEFLKKCGYRILTRHNDELGFDYSIAVKPDADVIEDEGFDNIGATFNDVVQDIILEKLLEWKKKS